MPAVSADGVPDLPVAVPASAVSPGVSSCSFVNAPGLTVIDDDAPDVDSASPEVRAAVRVMFSAFVYCTEASVVEFVPAVIVPV